jgi:hypothetical protein
MATSDVNTLFRRFGGNASGYQEIISRDQVTQAETKWPMLGQIKPTTPHDAPSARRAAPSGVRQIQEDESPRQSAPVRPEPASTVVQSVHQKEQGLQHVFKALSPEPPVPTGPAERVFKSEKASGVSVSAGLFAGFQSPTVTEKKPQKQSSTGVVFPHQTPRIAATDSSKSIEDASAENLLGRRFGGGSAAPSPVATGLTKESSLNETSIRNNGGGKSSQLQQIFGKMVSQPDLPAQPKGEGISKRPIKW